MNPLPHPMAMLLPVRSEAGDAQRIGIVRGDHAMWLRWHDAYRTAYDAGPREGSTLRLPAPIGACPLIGRAMIEPALEERIVRVSGQGRKETVPAAAVRRVPTVPARSIDVVATSGGIEVAFLLPGGPVKTASRIGGYALLQAFAASAPADVLAARFTGIAEAYPYLALDVLDGLEVAGLRRAPLDRVEPDAVAALLENLDVQVRETVIARLRTLDRSRSVPSGRGGR